MTQSARRKDCTIGGVPCSDMKIEIKGEKGAKVRNYPKDRKPLPHPLGGIPSIVRASWTTQWGCAVAVIILTFMRPQLYKKLQEIIF